MYQYTGVGSLANLVYTTKSSYNKLVYITLIDLFYIYLHISVSIEYRDIFGKQQ